MSDGVKVSTRKDATEVGLSDHSVEVIVNGISDMWENTLAWAERNPILFVISMLVLLTALAIWMRHRTAVRTMKIDYKNARSRARIQLPLPLPEQDNRQPRRRDP